MKDPDVRAKLLAAWKRLGRKALAAHCGGRGLVIGCPVCRKRWR